MQSLITNQANYDLYEIIKAASAAPLIFDGEINIDGVNYLDAAAIDPLPIDIPDIKNAKKIIILTKGKAGLLKKLRYIMISLLFIALVLPFKSRRLNISKYIQYGLKPFKLNKLIAEAEKEELAGSAVLILPTKKIGGLLDNSSSTLLETYEHGREAARSKFSDIDRMISNMD